MSNIVDQPAPVATDRRPAWDIVVEYMLTKPRTDGYGDVHLQVVADMRERDQLGRARYGTPLTAGNGRDHLIDLYQEMLDASVYMAAWLDEYGYSPNDDIKGWWGECGWVAFNIQQMFRETIAKLLVLRAFIDRVPPPSTPWPGVSPNKRNEP